MTEKRVDVDKLKEAIRNHAENQRRDGQEYPAWVHERTVFMLIDSLAQPVELNALDQISSKDYGAVGLTHDEINSLAESVKIDSDRITGVVKRFVNDELYTYDVPVEGDEESYTVVVNAICKLFYSLVQLVEEHEALKAQRERYEKTLQMLAGKVDDCANCPNWVEGMPYIL